MNNKPVAYIDRQDLERLPHQDCWVNGQEHKNSVPLYTHPSEHDLGIAEAIGFDKGYKAATAKTLTDEEIAEEWAKFYPDVFHTHLIDFAKAILRKAQEK